MATQRGFIPREGLYIDPIIHVLRRTILHPIPATAFLYLVQVGKIRFVEQYQTLVQITTAASVILWLNDWLSTKSRNNWVTDDTWNWKKELVVVTGGSGGIGAGVAQSLADKGARVVVLDIIPLTFKPGIFE